MADFKPLISVVIGCHQDGELLAGTLSSIADQQQAPDWECLIVANGSFTAGVALTDRLASDRRFKLLYSPDKGLTAALRLGCSHASGALIARIDAGDAMESFRLKRQSSLMAEHDDCVLITGDVAVCGPNWEPLWINHGNRCLSGVPVRVDQLTPSNGISMDIPHHSSVLFRHSAYEFVGGYRREFYFGQDWDLWYRLAAVGSFFYTPEVLTRVRLFADGISSRHWREQRRIAQLSLACYNARRQGVTEDPFLAQAAEIFPSPPYIASQFFDQRRAEGAYFIAEALRRNGDVRCRAYFAKALRQAPWLVKAWLRTVQSLHLSPQQ